MRKIASYRLWLALFMAYFSLVTIPNAHAYVDPGTGSYIFQVLIGAFLAAGVALKVFWRRLTGLFTRRPRPSAEAPTAEATAPADRPADDRQA